MLGQRILTAAVLLVLLGAALLGGPRLPLYALNRPSCVIACELRHHTYWATAV